MKVVNDSIKNALKQPTTQRKGRILVDGNYYDVFNVEYYADAYNEGNVIGNAIASQLDFELPYMPKFETFKYFDGVWTGTNYEYIDMGTFHVFDEQDEDDFNKHITAFDNLIKFNAPFNDVGGYPKTLFQELQNVCNQAGVNLKNISITNGNFEVVNNQFVNGESLKTVLKAICQLAGMYAIIKNDEVVLQLKNQTNEVINKEQHEPTIWKRRSYGINQVILGLSDVEGEYVLREDAQDIAQNGVHKLVINDNPFAYTQEKRDELIDELFNQVRGFGYIPYEMNGEWLSYLEIGDIITLDDVETIVLRINGKSPKSLESMMSAPAIIDSSVEYVNNTNTVKNQLIRTEISVDKQNQQIEAVVSQTDEQNQKIARVTQTVDELNSKISDIADITISGEDTDAQVELENINESEPIRIVIRPIGENISYLYPSNNLFPSDTLFSKNRKVRFTNTKTNEFIDYELPMDLLYYDSENYDEFILDYDGQSCVVNKRIGYNPDGTTYILDNPTTLEFEYPRILLTDGDYNVTVLGYDTAYLFVRLMTQNIYTTQFYTKAETDSKISQTSEEINLSVNQKLSNYSTTAEMNAQIQLTANGINQTVSTKVGNNEIISSINQSAEEISINANKININGVISAINNNATTSIDGNKITTGTLNANKINGGTISGSSINLGNGTFSVNTNGVVNCKNITATGGTIGGFAINGEAIFNGKGIGVEGSCGMSANIADWAFWAGNGAFRVAQNGYVSCSNIYANGGYIGGWNIGDTELSGYDYDGNRWSILPAGIKDKYGNLVSWAALVQISDKRLKNEIKDIDEKFENLYNELSPKTFYFNDGCPDSKKHIGFIAQDVIKSQNKINEDLSMISQSPNGFYSLNKSEIIALNTWQIKKLKKEIQKLTETMKKFERLEEQLNVN